MSVEIPETLYNLLPAIYRRHDAENGEVLRALMAIIDAERRRIEGDIATLYDDQFIETCEPWAIAYIADLLDLKLPSTDSNPRAYVGNAIGFRRRKGVLQTLEELAASITGWPTVAVEFREQLAVAQHVNHPRPARTGFASVRDEERMAKNGGAFESAPRTAEVRLVDTGRGKYGVSNLGLFCWRARDYSIAGVRPARVDPADVGFSEEAGVHRFRMHPAGVDIALVNPAQSKEDHRRRTRERDVPAPLRRRALYTELKRRRELLPVEEPSYFGPGAAPFAVQIRADAGADYEDVAPAQLFVCNLEDWSAPDLGSPVEVRVVVDPELGRMIVLGELAESADIRVDYAYAALADIGGGPYERQASTDGWLGETGGVDFHIGVSREQAAGDAEVVETVQEALDLWLEFCEEFAAETSESESADDIAQPCFGVISILDNDSYFAADGASALKVYVPGGSRLAVVGARWPGGPASPRPRQVGDVVADGVRPHLAAKLEVIRPEIPADAELADKDPGGLILDGLLLNGAVEVAAGALSELSIFHSTLVPDRGGVAFLNSPTDAEPPVAALLNMRVNRSTTGPLRFGNLPADCLIEDSVVAPDPDASDHFCIDGSWLTLSVLRSTLLGEVRVERLEADDAIFYERVEADRRQEGCVRFSYAPSDSLLPRKYRCQPDARAEADRSSAGEFSADQRLAVEARLRPRFVSHRWWRPGFAQLQESCAPEILSGAEDGAEMGVYNHLHTPQRLANLRAALDEHLRVGIYAGIFYAT
jgi:hypothetical protein